MSRNSRRPVAIAIAGVFAVAPLVSACGAGSHPQSAKPTQLVEGVNAVANGVYVRNVFVLGPAPGQRLTPGASAPLYAWFVNKALSPDRLIAVETAGVAQSAEIAGGALTLPPGRLVKTVQSPGAQATAPPVPAPTATTPTASKSPAAKKTPAGRKPTPGASGSASPGTSATPTAPGAPGAPATPAGPQPSLIMLKGLSRELASGDTVRLVLHFQRAGAVTLNVAVMPRSGYYATYSPAPAEPTPSATPLPAQQPTATPKKAKKPSATPSA